MARSSTRNRVTVSGALLKRVPLPLRKLIGDLSDPGKILVGLDLRPRP